MYNIDEYKAIIRENLSDYRYNHSLCVAESAKALARRYGADENKAEAAGILHDVCKEMPAEKQLMLIEKAGMAPSDADMMSNKFFHQLSGAAYARVFLGIEDEELLNAIRYHTTGREGMSLMEQIVYLADFISADRDYDDIDKIRSETEKGLEYGLLYGSAYTIKSTVKKGKFLHPDTVNAYNWFVKTYFSEK